MRYILNEDRTRDEEALKRFSENMGEKLAEARWKGRGGWFDPSRCSEDYLLKLFVGHLLKGNKGNWVDLANIAMMLHERGVEEALLPTSITEQVTGGTS